MKSIYTIEKYDRLKGWRYLNSFCSYKEACEEMERLKRVFKAEYRVICNCGDIWSPLFYNHAL